MILLRVLDEHYVGTAKNTVFKRHTCEWILPQEVANKIKYNPRHLPVARETKNEDYNLYRSVLRILNGYRVIKTTVPPSPFND